MTNAELVEKIRRILEDPESSSSDELQKAAALYAARVRRVEDGFRRALARLNSGEVSDADRILTDEALLEDYDVLNLPGAEDWQVVCRTFDFEVAPSFDPGARDRLAAFRDEYAPVRDALARRRRQAMENAPSRSQLETLYAIEDKLGVRDFLTRQIERLERRRNEELADALNHVDDSNVLALDFAALFAEFNDPRRHTPVPQETLRKFKEWYDYTQSYNELMRLRDLIARWQAASQVPNSERLLAFLTEYRSGEFKHAAPYVTAEETQTLSALVDQALQLERVAALKEDARRKVETLRSALLRSNVDPDKLSDLYEAATIACNNAGTSIPPDVENDYQRQINSVVAQRRRRRVAVVAFSLVVVAFFAALVALSAIHSRNVKGSQAAAAAIEAQLETFARRTPDSAAALETAGSIVARFSEEKPKYAEFPEFSAAVEHYNTLAATEKTRLHEIEDLIDSIDDSHDNGIAVPSQIEKLKKTLIDDREKQKYDYTRLYRDDMNLRQSKNTENTDKYSALIDELTQKEHELEENSDLSVADSKRLVAELRSGLDSLRSQEKFAEISRPLVAARETLEAAFEGTERRFRLRSALDKHGAALSSAVGKSTEYVKTLKAIRDDAASLSANAGGENAAATQDALVLSLDEAIADVANAANAAAWNKFASSWGSVNKSAGSLSASEASSTALKGAGLSFAPEFTKYQKAREALDTFAKRGGYSSSARTLAAALEKYETPTWVFYDSKDERYFYLTSDPSEGTSNLKYLSDVEEGKPKDFPAKDFDPDALGAAAPSVQSMLAKKASEQLGSSAAPEDWFTVVEAGLIALDNAPETTLDPALKLRLLAAVVDSAKGYPGFDKLTKWLADTRKSSDFDFAVNVYQPGKETLEQRVAASKALRDAPDLQEALAAAKTAFDEGEESFACEYRWIGFLDEVNSGATLVPGSGKTAPEGATLWIARGTGATAEEIGTMTASGASFNSTKDWATYRWTPVYARIVK